MSDIDIKLENDDIDIEALASGIGEDLDIDVQIEDNETLRDRVTAIEQKIPNQATSDNKLADKDFVNSSINSVTAYYITKNAAKDSFETKAELDSATVYYSGGEVRIPTKNDYCIVRIDETKDKATTRYIYNNGAWEYQYTVNETALTSEQLKALNSGITDVLVAKINGIEEGANKTTKTSQLENDSGFLTQHQDVSGKEDKSNKVTTISNESTDTQYPSAKAVYTMIGDVESLLTNIAEGSVE